MGKKIMKSRLSPSESKMSLPYIYILNKPCNRYQYGLLDCAETIHCFCTGALECDPEMIYIAQYFVLARLNGWTEGLPSHRQFDDAVKRVCELACEEYDNIPDRDKMESYIRSKAMGREDTQ